SCRPRKIKDQRQSNIYLGQWTNTICYALYYPLCQCLEGVLAKKAFFIEGRQRPIGAYGCCIHCREITNSAIWWFGLKTLAQPKQQVTRQSTPLLNIATGGHALDEHWMRWGHRFPCQEQEDLSCHFSIRRIAQQLSLKIVLPLRGGGSQKTAGR